MKKSLSLFFLLLIANIGLRGAVRLTVEAPSEVAVGEQFRLTYTVNTQGADNFHAGNIPSSLEVLMGPSTSSQSSFQMVNGHTSSSSSITYTYILCANRNGSFVISPAHVTVGGRTISSSSHRIRVSGTASRSRSSAQSQSSQQPKMRLSGSRISGKDLFITVNANKRRVHEQEPIVLTYKVYTLVDLTQLEGRMPDLKGFHTQEVKLPQQKSFSLENYHGRSYRTVTWSQYVMFPQLTGKLSIPSIQFDGIVVQQNRNVDPFDAFFNGGAGYSEVKKSIKAPGITIQVDPLPARPSNFSGGVGRFTISASLNNRSCHANNPLTLRVSVSGIGNLKLIKQPQVKFPKDFDTYDAKVYDHTKLTKNGVEGKIDYDFLFVPRHQGKYTIPAVTYTYYDTGANSYRTIMTKPVDIMVLKGTGGEGSVNDYSGQEELKMLNQDIHFIKNGDHRLYKNFDYFFASPLYWTLLIVPFLVFIILFILFRKNAADAANMSRIKGKKANKMATRRLKTAYSLMKTGKNNEFYDEVLKALWGYIGDKLYMRVEQLSKDNVSDKLTQIGVNEELVKQFINALNDCEFARFAPGNQQGNMNKVYDTAINVIMRIENSLKGSRSIDFKTVVLLAMLAFSVNAIASPKADADSAYVHENYQKAITGYERILKDGQSADIYYNLGNAYYRTDNITKAVLNYERALLLDPGDGDIRFNLDMARNKTVDKITPSSEMFFFTWYRSLVNMMSVDEWAYTAVVCLVLFFLLLSLYLFYTKVLLRKIGFFGSIVALLIFVLSNLFAYQQRSQLIHRTGGIIISSAVSVKSTPTVNGTDLFVIHEGTKVEVIDDSMPGWKEVHVADGKEGWIETRQMEVI